MKLKDFTNTGEFRIIDDFNHRYVETLPRKEAIAKYGECDVAGSYTDGFCEESKPDGAPWFKTSVWVEIPGMKIGPWNGTNLHLYFIGDEREATFLGKKTGLLITVHRWGLDDYSAWWREDNEDRDYDFAGCAERGSAEQIIKALEGEI